MYSNVSDSKPMFKTMKKNRMEATTGDSVEESEDKGVRRTATRVR